MPSSPPFHAQKVAVLGAGVMGAQIAAHLVNAGVPATLFELPAKEGDANGNVLKAIDSLRKLEPSPLASAAKPAFIEAANYDQHLERLRECDLVIEAVAERMDIKKALYDKVAPHLAPDAIFASNTSGLSINALAQALPESVRGRFCGVHFFNPPRYMYLVELIPARDTQPGVLDALEGFLTTTLGKGVIRAKDTPNFIANRVGVFSILAAFHHTRAFGQGFDTIDALTGPLIGRPKSATYRTADVVGLDTLAHVVNTMKDGLPNDPWHRYFELPDWYRGLLEQKAFGQKSGRGVYRKVGKDIQVLDLAKLDYRPSEGEADAAVVEILKTRDVAERFQKLRASEHPQAKYRGSRRLEQVNWLTALIRRGGFRWSQSSTARPMSMVLRFSIVRLGPADAPKLLLLHGFPSASHMFRDLIPLLADRFHIVAPDLPGSG